MQRRPQIHYKPIICAGPELGMGTRSWTAVLNPQRGTNRKFENRIHTWVTLEGFGWINELPGSLSTCWGVQSFTSLRCSRGAFLQTCLFLTTTNESRVVLSACFIAFKYQCSLKSLNDPHPLLPHVCFSPTRHTLQSQEYLVTLRELKDGRRGLKGKRCVCVGGWRRQSGSHLGDSSTHKQTGENT